jgi:hypothetical protein
MPPRQTLAEQIREANATFLTELKTLEAMDADMTAIPAAEVSRRLRELRGVAAEHFRLEEQDAYLSPVVTCRPETELNRRALLADHRDLLQSLDGLIGTADAGEGLTGELRDRLAHWLRHAREHEQREDEFFTDAVGDNPC